MTTSLLLLHAQNYPYAPLGHHTSHSHVLHYVRKMFEFVYVSFNNQHKIYIIFNTFISNNRLLPLISLAFACPTFTQVKFAEICSTSCPFHSETLAWKNYINSFTIGIPSTAIYFVTPVCCFCSGWIRSVRKPALFSAFPRPSSSHRLRFNTPFPVRVAELIPLH